MEHDFSPGANMEVNEKKRAYCFYDVTLQCAFEDFFEKTKYTTPHIKNAG